MKPEYSGRRGYRILYLHCYQCKMERPFFRINSWPTPQKRIVHKIDGKFVIEPSAKPIPNISPNARLINATCMICGKTCHYVVSVKVLGRSRHAMGDLCSCGLPALHAGKHLEDVRGKAS